jgi:hypothetical protein
MPKRSYVKLLLSPRIVANESEAFGFYLSAFISAGRSVSWVLKHEETEKYDSRLPA